MIITFPLAFQNVPPNLRQIIENEEEEYHLAHYNIFFTDLIHKSASQKINNWAASYLHKEIEDIYVESRIHTSSKTQATGMGKLIQGDWIELDLLSIDASNPPFINSLVIDEGHLPNDETEIAILTSFAEADGLEIGDKLVIYGKGGVLEYAIVGLVKSIEYASFDLAQTAAAYATIDGIRRFFADDLDEDYHNSFLVYFQFDISLERLIDLHDFLQFQISNDSTITDEAFIFIFWFVRETSFRKALLDALELTTEYLFVASLFIFMVSGVIIFVTMNRYVNEQKTSIGALYAFGVKRREIVLSFFFRIFILSIISIILGLIAAKFLVHLLVSQMVAEWGLISVQSDLSTESIIYTVISASVVMYGFTFLAVINLVRMTPYEAMRGKSQDLKHGGLLFLIASILPTRLLRASMRNLTRNRTRSILTIVAFTLALTFSGSLIYTHQSVGYTIDKYYDERVNFDLEIELGFESIINKTTISNILALDTNNNGIADIINYELYIESFFTFANRPEILSFLMGYKHDSVMFAINDNTVSEGSWFRENSSDIVISRYVAGTLGVKMGSLFSFIFLGKLINGTVTGITNDLIRSSAIMMDINYLSQIFDPSGNITVANKILIQLEEGLDAKKIQDIINKDDPDIIIALRKEFYKNRFESLSASQTIIIYLMVTLGLIIGFISVFTTLLITIAERERELGLLHVYGHTKFELIFQIIVEGIFIGILSIIPTLFLSRFITKNIWINLVSEKLFEMNPFYSLQVTLILILFAFGSILISIIPSFIFTTNRKLAEVIREE